MTYPPSESAVSEIPVPDQGIVGTSALCATMVLEILSPKLRIALPGGPMKTILFLLAAKLSGKRGFSDACPHPAQTACTPARSAMSTMRSTLA